MLRGRWRARLAGRRRGDAVERLADVSWPTPSDEIWRYSRIDQLDLDNYRPFAIDELGEAGDERAPGGGPWAAEAGTHAGMIVVHDGRVVHHELDPALEAKGVRVCGIATCEDELVAVAARQCVGRVGRRVHRPARRLPRGRCVRARPGRSGGRHPILVLHWCEGDGRASFPHTLVSLGEGAEATVLDRFGSPQTDHLVDAVTELLVGDNAHLRYLLVQEHGSRTWHLGFQRAHVGRDATLRTSAVALGGDYARLRSEARSTARARRATSSPSTSVTAPRCSTSARCRTTPRRTPAATSCSRARSKTPPAPCIRAWCTCGRRRRRRNASQTNRNLVLTEGASAESIPNLEIEANDVKCSHASTVGPIDDEQLYYLESRGIPPEEAERLIVLGFFDDVFERLPVGALTRGLRRSVVDKLEHARARR